MAKLGNDMPAAVMPLTLLLNLSLFFLLAFSPAPALARHLLDKPFSKHYHDSDGDDLESIHDSRDFDANSGRQVAMDYHQDAYGPEDDSDGDDLESIHDSRDYEANSGRQVAMDDSAHYDDADDDFEEMDTPLTASSFLHPSPFASIDDTVSRINPPLLIASRFPVDTSVPTPLPPSGHFSSISGFVLLGGGHPQHHPAEVSSPAPAPANVPAPVYSSPAPAPMESSPAPAPA